MLNQPTIPQLIFFLILVTCQLDIILILNRRIVLVTHESEKVIIPFTCTCIWGCTDPSNNSILTCIKSKLSSRAGLLRLGINLVKEKQVGNFLKKECIHIECLSLKEMFQIWIESIVTIPWHFLYLSPYFSLLGELNGLR